MKNVILIVLIAIIFIAGCDGIRKIPAREFQTQYRLGKNQSMKSAEYLGKKDGRAFIRIKTMSAITQKWSEEIVYAELDELDPDFSARLPEKQR